MKQIYKVLIAAIAILAIIFIVWIVCFASRFTLPLDHLIQGLSIFVAIIAVTVAISASDQKPQKVNISIESYIAKANHTVHHMNMLSNDLKACYSNLPEKFRSYKVYFKLTNQSAFDLSRPIVTFELSTSLQHPAEFKTPGQGPSQKLFHTNLYGNRENMVHFWSGDKIILANNNFPFWNRGRTYEFWIEMVIDEVKYTPIEILLSVNCDNAEGISKTIIVDPAIFLKTNF